MKGPPVHAYHYVKDSFLVGEERELVVLLGRAWHIDVFQPLQHRTAFQVFWFEYVHYHEEPVGEEDAVKVKGKDSHRIPIVLGYNAAPLILEAEESQRSPTLEENPPGWVCIGRTWVA